LAQRKPEQAAALGETPHDEGVPAVAEK